MSSCHPSKYFEYTCNKLPRATKEILVEAVAPRVTAPSFKFMHWEHLTPRLNSKPRQSGATHLVNSHSRSGRPHSFVPIRNTKGKELFHVLVNSILLQVKVWSLEKKCQAFLCPRRFVISGNELPGMTVLHRGRVLGV